MPSMWIHLGHDPPCSDPPGDRECLDLSDTGRIARGGRRCASRSTTTPPGPPLKEMVPSFLMVQAAQRSLLIRGSFTADEIRLLMHSLDLRGLYRLIVVRDPLQDSPPALLSRVCAYPTESSDPFRRVLSASFSP